MIRLIFTALALLATAACIRTPARESSGVTVLSYASPYPPGHPFSRADIRWMKYVEQASGGRLRIQPFWAGSILSSDQSMAEIRHGVADIGLITPIYARGGAHTLRTQSGFYGGVRTLGDQVAIYRCLASRFPELNQELAGLHVLAVQGGNFPGVVTRKRAVRSLADLRGLRLRAPAENLDILRELGVDPVNMPMGEVYSALARGVIDGVVAPADTLKSLHFAEIAPHFSSLRVSRGAYPARAMSEARFRKLPLDLRQVLDRGAPVWEAALSDEINRAEQGGIELGRSQGVQFTTMPATDQKRFDALYNKYAARSARALVRFGSDGTPLFQAAQRMIATTPAGATPVCLPASGTPS